MFIKYNNGTYTGEVDYNEKRHGYGTYNWNSGDKYVGYWSHGDMHGRGKYYYTDGTYYDGDWKNSQRTGNGKKTYAFGASGAYFCSYRRNESGGIVA